MPLSGQPLGAIALKAASFGSAGRGVYIFDDFNRDDSATLGTTASGHAWALTGAGVGDAKIEDGRYINETTNYSYAYLDYGEPMPRISGVFSFAPHAGTTSRTATSLTLIADSAGTSGGLNTMLHLRLSPRAWVLEKRLSGGSFVTIASGSHVLSDYTPYEVAMAISTPDGVVTVYPPQGKPVTVTDSDITTIAPRYGCWEINNTNTSYHGRWEAVSMGHSQGARLAPIGGASPGADAALALGGVGTTKQRLSFVAADVGWYKVGTHGARVTNTIATLATITAQDSLRFTRWQVEAFGLPTGSPQLAHRSSAVYAGGPLTQVRLSNDGSASVQFDVYVAQANTSVQIDFVGEVTVVDNPSVGASALGGTSATLVVASTLLGQPGGRAGVTSVGDAAATLTAGSSTSTQIWDAPLTTNRAVSLSTTAAWSGAKFRVVRSAAATGASKLNVGAGPLKALDPGQWVEVEWDGSAWVLVAYGQL